jgi:hypothetical protein
MGANAVTTVYDFTAGQVLTAAQMDNVNCGIPVFATTTTRDAAFGGTGEKTLAEGQMAYIENISGSSAVQYYDGAAWQTLVVGGVTVVKAETTFSAVQTINVDNVFSSTYTNYLITIRGSATSATNMYWGLRTGGTTAATNYNEQNFVADSTTLTGLRLTAQTKASCGAFGTRTGYINLWLSGPNLAEATTAVAQCNYNTASGPIHYDTASDHTTATSYDGIAITSSQNITGTYTIYGLAKS